MFSPETLQALARMRHVEYEEQARLSRLLAESAKARPPTVDMFSRLVRAARWLAAGLRRQRPARPEREAEPLGHARFLRRRQFTL